MIIDTAFQIIDYLIAMSISLFFHIKRDIFYLSYPVLICSFV